MSRSNEAHDARLTRLLQFLDKDPRNIALLCDAAEAAIDAGKPGVAHDLMERAALAGALTPAQRSLGGLIAIRSGEYAQAQRIFEGLDAEAPHTPAIRFNLAWSLAMSRQFEAALAALDSATTASLPQAAALHVQTLHALGRFDDAARAAKEHIARFPDYRDLAAAVSVLALDIEDLDLARRCAAVGGGHPDALTTRATLALADSRNDEARRLFETAIAANAEQPRAWIGLGLLAMLNGDNVDAAKDIERGAGLFGDHIGSWIAAGWARLFARDFDAARRDFDAAMAIDRGFGETHGSLAVLSLLKGDVDAARRGAATALRLDPHSFSAALATAMIAAAGGDAQKSRAVLERALQTPIASDGRTLAQMLAAQGLRR
jgi:tetratricopeptide (TPR) repeat protein